jgi:hypothetical protein
MDVVNTTSTGTGKLRLFISYSRSDTDFADELVSGLEFDSAFDVAMDRHSIIEGEDWKKRLGALIADSDTVVFLLSPASAASSICRWEVEEAIRLTKRIVPILVAPLGRQEAPAALAALNYVRFDPHDDGKPRSFMAGLRGLVRALKSDLGWLREHTRLLIRATEWNEAGRPGNRLLTGEAVVEAKAWAARRPKDAPAINALHLDFLAASEAAEIARQSDAQRQIEERERLLAQAEKAAREREETTKQAEAAVERERAALRTSARMQRVATGLLIGIVAIAAGVISWAYHAKINDLYMWKVTMGGPFLSTAAQHSVRRPGEVFAECARGCPQMVVIPEGKFKMGASPDERPPYDRRVSSYPQHDVTIPNPIAVGRYTVTFE